MFRWLMQVLGVGGAAVAAVSDPAVAEQADPFALSIEAARDLSDEDSEIVKLLELARDNPDGFEQALSAPPYNSRDWYIDYVPGDLPGTLFRDAMMVKGLLAYLDWKEGFEEISGHYDNQMGRLGLPVLNDAVRNAMQARENAASGDDRLFFTDFIVDLDKDAQTKSHRVLCFDERADSYAFLVVTPAQFDRWQGVSLDPTNQFYSPEAFVTDQTR